MDILGAFRRREPRTRLIGTTLVLGAIASLPTPNSLGRFDPPLALLWFSLIALAWSLAFKPTFVTLFWSTSILVAFLAWKSIRVVVPMAFLCVWGLWFQIRTRRERLPALALGLGCALAALGGAPVHAAAPAEKLPTKAPVTKTKVATEKTLQIKAPEETPAQKKEEAKPTPPARPEPKAPKYLSGYVLNDLASCGAVDQIPWRFAAERKTRMLLRDHLRLNTDAKFGTWEIHQIMDRDGYVTYAFMRIENGQRVESLLIKDNVFNRFRWKGDKSKVVDVQDLRNLINRPVVIFSHEDTSSVSFSPGLAGQSVLAIELRQVTGRPLPPLYIRGTFCERATSSENSVDLLGKDRGATPAEGTATSP